MIIWAVSDEWLVGSNRLGLISIGELNFRMKSSFALRETCSSLYLRLDKIWLQRMVAVESHGSHPMVELIKVRLLEGPRQESRQYPEEE